MNVPAQAQLRARACSAVIVAQGASTRACACIARRVSANVIGQKHIGITAHLKAMPLSKDRNSDGVEYCPHNN
eukprot:6177111-Pleurochrysis_carterae.AAC.5